MGISGILLALFLSLHLAINLTSLISREAYETAWRFMNDNVLTQIIIPILVLGVLVHIVFGIITTIRNTKNFKAVKKENDNGIVFKNMLSLGVIVIGLLVLHLSQFWAKVHLDGENPYDIAKTLFYNGFYVAVYVIWIIALYFHLSRGFWNMFQFINTKKSKLISRLQIASKVFSTIIAAGFILIPVYFYLGLGYV